MRMRSPKPADAGSFCSAVGAFVDFAEHTGPEFVPPERTAIVTVDVGLVVEGELRV